VDLANAEHRTPRSSDIQQHRLWRVHGVIVPPRCPREIPGVPVNGRAITRPTRCFPSSNLRAISQCDTAPRSDHLFVRRNLEHAVARRVTQSVPRPHVFLAQLLDNFCPGRRLFPSVFRPICFSNGSSTSGGNPCLYTGNACSSTLLPFPVAGGRVLSRRTRRPFPIKSARRLCRLQMLQRRDMAKPKFMSVGIRNGRDSAMWPSVLRPTSPYSAASAIRQSPPIQHDPYHAPQTSPLDCPPRFAHQPPESTVASYQLHCISL